MAQNFKKSIWCIAGPTAVGKTSVAINLAEALGTEILSFDSRQFYREIPIGTAAPNEEEQKRVKHHFILDRSVKDEFNAAAFAEDAAIRIAELHQKYDTLILVGGSGLYLKALIEGFDEMPEVAAGIREELQLELETKGLECLQHELRSSDPDYYAQMDIQNPQRLIRALEVIRSSGQPYSSFRNQAKKQLPYTVRKIGLELDRSELYDRINRRVGLMVSEGLLEEARPLIDLKELNALQTVGYKELFPYFEGAYDLEFALDEIRKNSRRYAKRQMTWFRREQNMEWYHPKDWEKILMNKA
ncbi:tRNA (adenosine(37)-N6)-dimethylallyltransferase MiaA [Croceimicrobium hydrocarbonivorans]|uniref:tRNA (adenosine(37)-N6)-dimethylallyltransferase MiaA n=1 Tax=Croceimicrobium hydrocarbonivorans TaxID=2761580 RepID=UPI001FE33C29|nr:tRNA (adenosine(37)-N6)-dimethylallyltransferase MiaA [Croceimicrobium hydrocarbonivorans]